MELSQFRSSIKEIKELEQSARQPMHVPLPTGPNLPSAQPPSLSPLYLLCDPQTTIQHACTKEASHVEVEPPGFQFMPAVCVLPLVSTEKSLARTTHTEVVCWQPSPPQQAALAYPFLGLPPPRQSLSQHCPQRQQTSSLSIQQHTPAVPEAISSTQLLVLPFSPSLGSSQPSPASVLPGTFGKQVEGTAGAGSASPTSPFAMPGRGCNFEPCLHFIPSFRAQRH